MASLDQEWETAWLRGRHPPKHSLWGSAKQPWLNICKGKPLSDFFFYLEQETAPTPCAWPNPWATQITLPSLFIRQTRRLLSCNGKGQKLLCFFTSDQFPMHSPHLWVWLFTYFQDWTFACIYQSRGGQTQPSRVHYRLGFQHGGLFLGVSGQLAPFLPTQFLCRAPHQSHTDDMSEL